MCWPNKVLRAGHSGFFSHCLFFLTTPTPPKKKDILTNKTLSLVTWITNPVMFSTTSREWKKFCAVLSRKEMQRWSDRLNLLSSSSIQVRTDAASWAVNLSQKPQESSCFHLALKLSKYNNSVMVWEGVNSECQDLNVRCIFIFPFLLQL